MCSAEDWRSMTQGVIIGAIGVSGDTCCADHNIAWQVRDALGLDLVPGGVSATGDDNIIYDIGDDGVSESGFGHPECADAATATAWPSQPTFRSAPGSAVQ